MNYFFILCTSRIYYFLLFTIASRINISGSVMWASRHAQPIPAGSTHTTCCPKCLLPSSRSYSTNAKTARPALTCLSATNLQRRQPHLLSVAASSGVQLEGAPGTSCSTSSEVDSKHSGQIQGQLEAGLQQIIRDLRPEVGGLEPGQPSNSDGGGKDDAAVSSSGSRHLEEAVVPNGEDLTEPKYKTVMLKVINCLNCACIMCSKCTFVPVCMRVNIQGLGFRHMHHTHTHTHTHTHAHTHTHTHF